MLFEAFIAHLVGDYVLQSHWMATEKIKRWIPALVHAVTYTLPFVLLTHFAWALLIIGGTHAVLDHYRLPKYLIWAKNQIGPRNFRPPWSEAVANNGFPVAVPAGLSTTLLIVVDNTLHLIINSGSLALFGH